MKSFNGLCLMGVCLLGCNLPRYDGGLQSGSMDPYEISSDSQVVEVANEEIVGRGRIVFTNPLLNSNSSEHYRLEWVPNDTESWFLELHSHFSGFPYRDGVQLRLFSEDGKMLRLAVSSPGYPYKQSVELFSFEPNQRLRVRIEVHDGVSSGVRVVLWHDLVSFDQKRFESQPRIFLGNHTFDSEEEGWSFRSHGQSLFWGLEFEGIRLMSARRQKAVVDEI